MSRSTKIEFEATVLNGLPVLVKATIFPPEPDIGIFGEQVEIDDICWLSGKTLPTPMQDRIDANNEVERLQEVALES